MEKRYWWVWPLMPFSHAFKADTELPPEATFRMYFLMVDEEVKGTRRVFPEMGRILSIYNWMCFLVADLWFILLNQCQLQFCFVLFLYGAIHLGGQSNDLLFALDSVSIDSHLVYSELNFYLAPIHVSHHESRAASSTAGQLWTCEKGQGPASLFQTLFQEFLWHCYCLNC